MLDVTDAANLAVLIDGWTQVQRQTVLRALTTRLVGEQPIDQYTAMLSLRSRADVRPTHVASADARCWASIRPTRLIILEPMISVPQEREDVSAIASRLRAQRFEVKEQIERLNRTRWSRFWHRRAIAEHKAARDVLGSALSCAEVASRGERSMLFLRSNWRIDGVFFGGQAALPAYAQIPGSAFPDHNGFSVPLSWDGASIPPGVDVTINVVNTHPTLAAPFFALLLGERVAEEARPAPPVVDNDAQTRLALIRTILDGYTPPAA